MNNKYEIDYLNILQKLVNISDNDKPRENRTDTKTYSYFFDTLDIDISDYKIPLLSTKSVHFKSILVELLWFLRGDTRTEFLDENNCKIWKEWYKSYYAWDNIQGKHIKKYYLPNTYPEQWRYWGMSFKNIDRSGYYNNTLDQVMSLIDKLKNDKYSRRLIINNWSPHDEDRAALPCCHTWQQYYVNKDDELELHFNMRSSDAFLGLPFNIASYAIMAHLIANEVGLKASRLKVTLGDVHLYENHINAAKEQLSREIINENKPTLNLDKYNENKRSIYIKETTELIKVEDIVLEGYTSHGKIRAPVAV